jgi:hypothetical protein
MGLGCSHADSQSSVADNVADSHQWLTTLRAPKPCQTIPREPHVRPCFDVLGRDRPGTCSYLWPGFHGDTCAMVLVYFDSVQAACSLVSCLDSGSYGMGAAVFVSECQSC